MNKTATEIAKIRQCSRQAVKIFLDKNKIKPTGKKGKYPTYDCAKEPLAKYIIGKNIEIKKPAEQDTAGIDIKSLLGEKQTENNAVQKISKPLNDLLAGRVPNGQKPAAMFFAEALKLAKENKDATLYFKLGQIAAKEDSEEELRLQALKTEQAKEQIAQEKAERLKIENEIRRGMYIENEKVKIIFGRLYAVDTGVLMSLGLKVSDMINALPQGNNRRDKIQKIIDDEIFAALESKKRILKEFVES